MWITALSKAHLLEIINLQNYQTVIVVTLVVIKKLAFR